MDATSDEEEEQQEKELFNPRCQVSLRNFKGNSSAPEIGMWDIPCATLLEFKESLWDKVALHIKREVVFDEDYIPSWHEKEFPDMDDLNKFVGFADKKPGKRVYNLENITTANLQAWRNHPVCLYIYLYSGSVSSATLFKTVQRVLLKPKQKDRGGAPSNLVTAELSKRLKELHGHRYHTSSDIHWDLWANDLLGSEAHTQEQAINDPPPDGLLHLFTHVRRNSIERTGPSSNIHLPISEGINEDLFAELSFLRGKLESVFDAYTALGDAMKDLLNAFTALTMRCSINQDLVSRMSAGAAAEETSSSQGFSINIERSTDTNH